ITWGETLIPGYPQWLSQAGGARFDDKDQKIAYTKYWKESLRIDDPIIIEMKELTRGNDVMLMGGIAEQDGGSIYCTLLTIQHGELLGRHRKIKPTYEERLVWADGDAEGLKVYDSAVGKIGGLNCWENWIPYCRAALHDQGEMVHVSVWPGSIDTTKTIAKFMAKEGRSWVIAASGMIRSKDFEHLNGKEFPLKQAMIDGRETYQNGGSMIVDPKGNVVAGPLIDEEGIIYADIDEDIVIQERQNFDYSGHYSRKDIFELRVNKPQQNEQ
ncbi:MAG: carbon-nitrogen hydrolase family protein, partial [Candidatus Heimdallarchaeota archaeon]|nr:carbon-nitrogen hydrolase family protein [Candidatus Heimdallarchaeota archaeon]